ncbi:MAG: UxaA family hydrolase [Desulfopila sp.]
MSSPVRSVLRLNAADNVVVAVTALPAATVIESEHFVCLGDIPQFHKVATRMIGKGETIIKYGEIIGVATAEIRAGEHVHTHNMGMHHYDRSYSIGTASRPTDFVAEEKRATFAGIVRPDGRVGTRNFIGVMAASHCSSGVSKFIAEACGKEMLADYPNVDGVVPIIHHSGCGLADHGDGIDYLRRTLVGWANHPNFYGVVLVGHGCEINQIDDLVPMMRISPHLNLYAMNVQSSGGTRKTVQRGVDAIKEMLVDADRVRRQQVSAANLIVGLECGGSDALSGITANPALGYASDLVVRHGGTSILSETSEIYGAEQLLMQRAASKEVAEKLIERLHWWEAFTKRHGIELNNNPSPGNKAGGLTTILEKSMGAVAKSGSTTLTGVYNFAEPVTARGQVFMDTPGYDMVSVTGMVAGGANMICFTTGRGSVFGSKPVPTIKLATNSGMYHEMEEDMDVNCGEIVDGKATVEEVGTRVFNLLLDIASGTKSKSELLGFGDVEFAPWMLGATL